MTESFVSLILGVTFSLWHIIIVIVLLKYIQKIAPVLIHAASALFSFILLCLVAMLVQFPFWIAFSVLSFCVSSYLFLFGAVYKSITLRMLCAVQSRKGSMSIDKLEKEVILPTFNVRISLLNEMGNVVTEKNRYFLTAKGKKFAQFFGAIRRVFHIDTKAVYELEKSSLQKLR